MELDGDVVIVDRVVLRQCRFQRIGFDDFVVCPTLQSYAWLVVFSRGGTEEPEMGGLADDQADGIRGDVEFRAFFHSERNDTQGSKWSGCAGNGQAGGFDADVITSCCAAADSNASVDLGPAVIGGAACHGVIEIVDAFQNLRRIFREPLLQRVEQSSSKRIGFEDAPIKQYVRRVRGAFCFAAMILQKGGQMFRDRRVGFVGQTDFLKARAALSSRLVVDFTLRKEAVDEQLQCRIATNFHRHRTAD